MRNSRIFLDLALRADSELRIDGEVWHYLAHVLRVQPGGMLTVFNGQGGEYNAQISSLDKKSLCLRLGEHEAIERESLLDLTLAQGISRPEHMDYTIQKAVELGVTRLLPLLSERSLRLDTARLDKRLRHWQGIVRSACEQCGRNRLPEILPVQTLSAWLENNAVSGTRLVLAPEGEFSPARLAAPPGPLSILAGPEGGWSAAELTACKQAGCTPLRLGPRILRTETAGLAALALCQSLWGDWR